MSKSINIGDDRRLFVIDTGSDFILNYQKQEQDGCVTKTTSIRLSYEAVEATVLLLGDLMVEKYQELGKD